MHNGFFSFFPSNFQWVSGVCDLAIQLLPTVFVKKNIFFNFQWSLYYCTAKLFPRHFSRSDMDSADFASIWRMRLVRGSEHFHTLGWTTLSPVPSSTRSVPGIPLLLCWSPLLWRLDPYCNLCAFWLVPRLHLFLPNLNTLVWPLPNLRIQVRQSWSHWVFEIWFVMPPHC